MDRDFIAKHVLCGSVPVMCGAALYFLMLYTAGRKQSAEHIITSLLFCLYIVGILTVTGICVKAAFSPRIVLVPFVDMISGPVDTVLNILMFIPMGFFLPAMYKEYDRISRTAVTALLISLSIETVQAFGYGTTDINDLITNTAGACTGYIMYRALCSTVLRPWIKRSRIKGIRCSCELLFFCLFSLLSMITVQVSIYHAVFMH